MFDLSKISKTFRGPILLATLLLIALGTLRYFRAVVINAAKVEAEQELAAAKEPIQLDDSPSKSVGAVPDPRPSAPAQDIDDEAQSDPQSITSSPSGDIPQKPIDAAELKRRLEVFSQQVPRSMADLQTIEDSVVDLVPSAIAGTIAIRANFTQGSGVIVTSDGYALTAAHVAEKVHRSLEITLSDGRQTSGKTVYIDRTHDFAIIQFDTDGPWPAAMLAEDSTAKPGDWCLATGHPGGHVEGRPAVVRLGRLIAVDDDVLESDCPLVGGDSGGPLFDVHGRIIGIHSRIGPSVMRNFHVPIKSYQSRWDEIIQLAKDERAGDPLASSTGVAEESPSEKLPTDGDSDNVPPTPQSAIRSDDSTDERPSVNSVDDPPAVARRPGNSGDELPPLNEKFAENNPRPFLGLYPEDVLRGCRVVEILDGSPADKGGILLDDILMKVDDTLIRSSSHLSDMIADKSPGDKIVLTIQREDQFLKKEVVLGSRKSAP
ncbi:MAG: S1C family serine protease [Planctomycetaceae bacterium]